MGVTDSTLPGTARRPVQPNDAAGNRPVDLSWRFWILVALVGVGAGLGAGVLMLLLRAVQHLAFSYRTGNFLEGVQHVDVARRCLVVVAGGIVASVGIYLLRHSAGGSGGKLNERIWFHAGRLTEGKTIAQSVLSIVIVGLGASLGRETAPKQVGASIASFLSRRARLSPGESRLLAACGAGAGMGAVYNVPLGGALFALEVLLGTLELPLIPPALAASFIATAVSWLMLPNHPTYRIAPFHAATPLLAWSVLFGPLAGLASVLYVRLIVQADSVKPRGFAGFLMPVAVFAGLAGLAIPYPQLLGNGKDVVQLAFQGALELPLLAVLIVLKPVATASCLGCGAPGGLFTPTITLGALLGALAGLIWSLLWPGGGAGSYAVVGAAAVLAASMQAPIAAVVLLWELSSHITALMVPILVAVTGATVVARRLDPRSIYSGRVHTGRGAIEAEPPAVAVAFSDLMVAECRIISAAANYAEVLERAIVSPGRTVPLHVIDETARLVGRIMPEALVSPPALTQVLSAGAAGDLMEPVEPLHPRLTRSAALARLRADRAGRLPVTDDVSGQVVGVAVDPARRDR